MTIKELASEEILSREHQQPDVEATCTLFLCFFFCSIIFIYHAVFPAFTSFWVQQLLSALSGPKYIQ